MNKLNPNYWLVEKIEAMRRARNAKFYAGAQITERSKTQFLETCSAYVKRAREYNREMILAKINA